MSEPSSTPYSGDAPDRTAPADSSSRNATGVPARVGRYTVSAVLGEGAFGRVYRGFDPKLDREVAIKVPHASALTPDLRERFLREARAAAAIHHPNVCPIYDVETDGDLPYIVMRFVPGGTLAGVLEKRRKPYLARDAAAIVRKIALGVAAAHAQDVLHRDLKPANVLWDEATREVLVTDFGLARLAGASHLSRTGDILGTPAYMSPEQARARQEEIGPPTDVYSLGVILYRLVTGMLPFNGSVMEVLAQAQFDEPSPPSEVRPGLDPRVDVLCATAMAKAVTDRYPSAKAFADALADYLRASAAGGTEGTGETHPVAPRRDASQGSIATGSDWADAASATAQYEPAPSASRPRTVARSTAWIYLGVGVGVVTLVGVVIALTLKVKTDPGTGDEISRAGKAGDQTFGKTQLLWLLTQTRLAKFSRHTAPIKTVVFSRDGSRVMTGDSGTKLGCARVWNPTTTTEIATMSSPTDGPPLSMSPDGEQVVFGTRGRAVVCDVATNKIIHNFDGHGTRDAMSAAFSPDGTRLVVAGATVAKIWNLKTGEPVLTMAFSNIETWTAVFSPDGKRVATTDCRYGLREVAHVWNVSTMQQLTTCRTRTDSAAGGHTSNVTAVAFSPDGTRLVTASEDKTAQVWYAATGAPLVTCRGHTKGVQAVTFGADGTRVATGGSDNTVRIWDANTGEQLALLADHTDAVRGLAFSPDGTRLVTASDDKTARVYQVAERR